MNANTQTFSYDPNHPHAVSGYRTSTFAYDANGNQVGRTAGGLTTTFSYDTENRLVEASGAASASYIYDGDGVLVKSVSAEGTTVYVGGIFEAFIPNAEPEPTATPTTAPTATATPPSGNDPTTGVLDDFNRADGTIGSGWSGTTSAYTISGNELRSSGSGVIFWGGESFEANQEAYYTVGSLESNTRIRLVLKSQSNTNYASGLLFVDYHTSAGSVKVMTFTTEHPHPGWGQGSYVQRGSTVYATFAAGDRLWAKADSAGQVAVYKNGDLLATVDVTGWPYYANGGYIGVWTSNVMTGTTFDDFGGGATPTAFRLGDALASLWNDFTGWLGKAFKAQPVQASVSQTISAPPAGEVWKNYVFAGSARIAVRTFENGSTTGTVTFLISDHLGSLSVAADAGGNLVGQMRYTAFGEVRIGSIGATDYTYTGQLSQMDEVGLMYFRARWMDPATATFTSADTLVPDAYNPMDWNRFGYVRANPVKFSDPTGHMVWDGCTGDAGNCGSRINNTVQIEEKEKRKPQPIKHVVHTTDNGCSGPNPSLVCLDPSLISKGQVQTNTVYPIERVPENYEGPFSDEKCSGHPICLILLLGDLAHFYQYQTDLPARLTKNSVVANINYEIHQNQVTTESLSFPILEQSHYYYSTVPTLSISNQTKSTISLLSVDVNITEKLLNPPTLIESGQSLKIDMPNVHYSGRSGSISLHMVSEMYIPFSLVAEFP